MASPAEPAHPLTPPAEASQPTQTTQLTSPSNPTTRVEALLSQPLTSLDDNGLSKRPRDHRLIHLLLASHGVSAYQERVPLQLLDFAYRYTSSVLADALHIQNEGYDQAENAGAGGGTSKGAGRGGGKGHNKNNEEGDLGLNALRFSIGSRVGYQFSSSLPKEFLKQLADERNRISLNAHARDERGAASVVGGVKLPHEKYCLTGLGWGLKDEWESDGEESVDDEGPGDVKAENGDSMQLDGPADDAEEGDEEGMGNMEDVFGPDNGGAGGDDTEMQD